MLKTLWSLARDVLIYGASNVLGQLVGFLLLPLYTRFLSPTEYGVLAMLTIASAVLSGVGALGLPKGLLRFVIGNDDAGDRAKLVSTCMVAVMAASAALVGIVLLTAGPLSDLLIGTPEHASMVRWIAVQAGLAAIASVPVALLRASRRVGRIGFINVSRVVVQSATSIVAVAWMEAGVGGIVAGGIAGELWALVGASVSSLRGFAWAPRREAFRRLSRYGLPMVPHELQATALAVFGQYVVRDMLGLEEAGHLAIATRFVAPITLVVSATQRAWAPFKLDVHAKDSDPSGTLGAVVTYFLGFLLAVWVGVATLGPTVVAELLDARYDRAADLVFVASLVPLALAIYMMAGTGFEIARDTRVLPLVSFGGLVVVVVATYLLVPQLAAEGAVVATLGGWIVMSVAVYFIARARFVVQYDALVLVSLVLVAATCAVLGRTSIAVAVVATVSFPVLAILVLCARSTHRARLKTFLARARGRRGEAAKATGERVT